MNTLPSTPPELPHGFSFGVQKSLSHDDLLCLLEHHKTFFLYIQYWNYHNSFDRDILLRVQKINEGIVLTHSDSRGETFIFPQVASLALGERDIPGITKTPNEIKHIQSVQYTNDTGTGLILDVQKLIRHNNVNFCQ